MYQYKSSAELKRLAKGQLIGKYGTVVGAYLIYFVIIFAIILVTAFTILPTSFGGNIIYFLILFLTQLIVGVFGVGMNYLHLNIASQKPFQVADLFFGFQFHPDKAIIMSFIIGVITNVAMIPYYIFNYVNLTSPSGGVFLGLCLCYLFAQIVSLYIDIIYSQRFYIMLDLQGYNARETLRMSKEFMKGHKGRFFYLSFSFIPLMLLGILSCGVALLWVMPYMSQTMANFYLDLMNGNNEKQSVG